MGKAKKSQTDKPELTAAEVADARREAAEQIKRAKTARLLNEHFVALGNVMGSHARLHGDQITAEASGTRVEDALEGPYEAIEAAIDDPEVAKRLEQPLQQIADAMFRASYTPSIATIWHSLHRHHLETMIELGKLTEYPDRPQLADEAEGIVEATRRILIERGASSYAAVRATAGLTRLSSRALPDALTRAAQRQAVRARKRVEQRLLDGQRDLRASRRRLTSGERFASMLASLGIERA